MRIQRDIAKRRRRRMVLLTARLLFFVMLPTFLAGYYYYVVATPLYATKSEFQIQQAENPAMAGMGGLLSGTTFATSQDSIAVQGYLQSRDAMMRLDKDIGFRSHFSQPWIDPLQKLAADATSEAAYKIYQRNVKIAYDPTEGIIKMEVIAADPQTAEAYNRSLISYAEEQVDNLTSRMREDQMAGATASYTDTEAKMLTAQRRVIELQERYKVLSSEVEVTLLTTQIALLETQLTTDRLSLQQMESNANPNAARMEPIRRRIAALEGEIALLRAKMTEDGEGGFSLAKVQSELLVAQADVTTRQLMLAQSLQSLETARVEANRQVRYLTLSVNPTAPDEASYPRAFENTLVAMLIFAGIYLMISMTAAILREQVSA
jgi:capsular polysaccharide transport system permease protein